MILKEQKNRSQNKKSQKIEERNRESKNQEETRELGIIQGAWQKIKDMYEGVIGSFVVKYFVVSLFLDLLIFNYTAAGNNMADNILKSRLNITRARSLFFQKVKYLLSIRAQATVRLLQWLLWKYQNRISRLKIILTVMTFYGMFLTTVFLTLVHSIGIYFYNRTDLTIASILTGSHAEFRIGDDGGITHMVMYMFVIGQNLDYLGKMATTTEYADRIYVWKPYQEVISKSRFIMVILISMLKLEQRLLVYALIETALGAMSCLIGVIYVIYQTRSGGFKIVENEESIFQMINLEYMEKWVMITIHKLFLTRHRLDYYVVLSRLIEDEDLVLKISKGQSMLTAQAWGAAIESHIGHFSKYYLSDKLESKKELSAEFKGVFTRRRYKGWIAMIPLIGLVIHNNIIRQSNVRLLLIILTIVHAVGSQVAINIDAFMIIQQQRYETIKMITELFVHLTLSRVLILGEETYQVIANIRMINRVDLYLTYVAIFVTLRAYYRYSDAELVAQK